jgi:hypothetical protein
LKTRNFEGITNFFMSNFYDGSGRQGQYYPPNVGGGYAVSQQAPGASYNNPYVAQHGVNEASTLSPSYVTSSPYASAHPHNNQDNAQVVTSSASNAGVYYNDYASSQHYEYRQPANNSHQPNIQYQPNVEYTSIQQQYTPSNQHQQHQHYQHQSQASMHSQINATPNLTLTQKREARRTIQQNNLHKKENDDNAFYWGCIRQHQRRLTDDEGYRARHGEFPL